MYDGGIESIKGAGSAGAEPRTSGGETAAHRSLKRLGLDWLAGRGCRVSAMEVRLPLSPFRVDVAGYRSAGRMGVFGDTYALECKQSRADFLRDAGLEAESRGERGQLAGELETLRALLSTHLPECRRGHSLFQEFDEYDFSDLRHERWRRLVARLDLLERRLAEGVKFSRIARYGSANYCFLVVTEGVVNDLREIPAGWGCLRQEGDALRELHPAPRLRSRDEAKLAYLERMAAKRLPAITRLRRVTDVSSASPDGRSCRQRYTRG